MIDMLSLPMTQKIAIGRTLSPRGSTKSAPEVKASNHKSTLKELDDFDDE